LLLKQQRLVSTKKLLKEPRLLRRRLHQRIRPMRPGLPTCRANTLLKLSRKLKQRLSKSLSKRLRRMRKKNLRKSLMRRKKKKTRRIRRTRRVMMRTKMMMKKMKMTILKPSLTTSKRKVARNEYIITSTFPSSYFNDH